MTTTATRPAPQVWTCPKCGEWFAAFVPVLTASHECPKDRPSAPRRRFKQEPTR